VDFKTKAEGKEERGKEENNSKLESSMDVMMQRAD
jgi:hypothetical protein